MPVQSPTPPATPALHRLMNENEAAEFLGISRATLRNRRWRREPPIYRKLGPRTVRYHRADLEAFARPVNVPDAP